MRSVMRAGRHNLVGNKLSTRWLFAADDSARGDWIEDKNKRGVPLAHEPLRFRFFREKTPF